MLAIQVPTWMRRVAAPMSCAVAMTSLLTSAAKIASKPASSASRAIAWISLARQPIPGMTASPSRSAMGVSFQKLRELCRLLHREVGGLGTFEECRFDLSPRVSLFVFAELSNQFAHRQRFRVFER